MTGDVPVFADMLSDDAIAAELERRRVRLAAVDAGDGVATVAALAWTVGEATFATPLTDVAGVGPMERITVVPGAPAALIGLFARCGVVNSLFDPGPALGIGATAGPGGVMILLRGTRPRIAVRADAAPGVVDVPIDAGPGDAVARMRILSDGARISIVDTGRLIGQLTGAVPAPFFPEG